MLSNSTSSCFARHPCHKILAVQAGAQSILEAAALAGQAGPSSPEWCSTYPASIPSTHGFSAEHVLLPGSVPSGLSLFDFLPLKICATASKSFCPSHNYLCVCTVRLCLQSTPLGELYLLTMVLAEALSQQCLMRLSLSPFSSQKSADPQLIEPQCAMERCRSLSNC